MEAIPTIVCDTLYAMGLHDQTPSWKIMDSKGRITVVLCWDGAGTALTTDSGAGSTYPAIGTRQNSTASTIASGGPARHLLGVRSFSHQVTRIQNMN